jgi:hypothetical protein
LTILTDQTNKINIIQHRLEEVKLNFNRLLEGISDDDWERKIHGKGWTPQQEMVHIVQALEVLIAGVTRQHQEENDPHLDLYRPEFEAGSMATYSFP